MFVENTFTHECQSDGLYGVSEVLFGVYRKLFVYLKNIDMSARIQKL